MTHKFKVGDSVVYTNSFGVCWGVKVITALDTRGDRLTYHYADSDTPWFSVGEESFTLADESDLMAARRGDAEFLQAKHGFTPTLEQLGGCY